jgi:hypothetical protein
LISGEKNGLMTGIPGERCCRIILVAGFDGRCGMMVK